ncbi:Na+/H+ antiporter subunit E [Corynebacterium mendelii]|uniref:Na+/H+ antiporter subunit E n=1 Tax=Corynebacterium mendelii TaxID=2765362 RepID=A0A939E3K1_9CORY|nr:Na+/H+ antiporter subunit E [Corynebacterium mendelii]
MIQGIKRRFRPVSIIILAAMWVLLVGQLTIGNVAAGLMLSLAVTMLLPLPAMPVDGITVRIIPLMALLAEFAADMITSSIHVAAIAVRPSPQPPAAFVVVPMRVRDDLIFSLAVTMLNLQPGGTVTDLSVADRSLTLHLLDGSSPKAIDRAVGRIEKLEKQLITIFETPPQRSRKRKGTP